MPIYQFTCKQCRHTTEEFMHSTQLKDLIDCEQCGAPVKRNTVYKINASVNGDFNSKPRGQVIKEKNEMLKKKHAGYSYEEKSMRSKIEAEVAQKVGTGDGS